MADSGLEDLRAQRQQRLQELARVGPLIRGSLAAVGVRCGHPTCRCARGERHRAYVLTRTVAGRTQTIHVPRALVEEVTQWVQEHRRLKQLIQEISALSEQLIRQHVRGGGARDVRGVNPSPRRTRRSPS